MALGDFPALGPPPENRPLIQEIDAKQSGGGGSVLSGNLAGFQREGRIVIGVSGAADSRALTIPAPVCPATLTPLLTLVTRALVFLSCLTLYE